jgi:kynurenine formamidase
LYTGFCDVLLEHGGHPTPEAADACCALDGRDQRLLQWITDSGVAAICADNVAVEAMSPKPQGSERQPMLPLHEHCLFKLGVHLGELWYLTELAAWLAKSRRNAFLLTAPPLRMPGCVGSPVTPVATV